MTSQDEIPDGIIRAFRKAIRAKNSMCYLKYDDAFKWVEGVMWELVKLYPEITKYEKEE